MLLSFIGSILAIAGLTQAWFIRPPTDLLHKKGAAGVGVRYKQVPTGICETRSNVKHLAGYVDVHKDAHIFFQFFETRNGDPKKAPLTLFLNGGPGASSAFAMMAELGPCGVNESGQVYDNPHSWSSSSNMLFIDQPVTSGFSYVEPRPGYFNNDTDTDKGLVFLPSEHCPDYAVKYACGTYSTQSISKLPRTTAQAAPHFYNTLQGFIGAFPEYAQNGINLMGESYAGRYIPVFAEYILNKNKEAPVGHQHINLTHIAVGNGCYDSDVLFRAHVDMILDNAYGVTYPNASARSEVLNLLNGPGNCLDQLKECYETSDDLICYYAREWCFEHAEGTFTDSTGRSFYDVRRFDADKGPYVYFRDYLNTELVQQSLGVFVNYSDSSSIIYDIFRLAGDLGRESHSSRRFRKLVDAGLTVALYAGDADYVCSWNGNEEVAEKVGVFGDAGYANFTAGGIVRGHVKQAAGFSFTRFFYAGHEVPWYQPSASLEFFKRVIEGRDIATGTQRVRSSSTYKTKGPANSDVFFGNATVAFEPLAENATFAYVDYADPAWNATKST